jgi:hypothetical protein
LAVFANLTSCFLFQHASHASQYYNSMANNVSAGLGSPLSAHKIHELHERALKSPSSGKSSPAPSMMSGVSSLSQLTSLSTGTTVTAATNTKSSTDPTGFRNKDMASPSLNPARLTPTSRGRSPPPLRHVHTHTHTHYGLGYPLLPPPGAVPPVPGVAPPAHTPFPAPGFPRKLICSTAKSRKISIILFCFSFSSSWKARGPTNVPAKVKKN